MITSPLHELLRLRTREQHVALEDEMNLLDPSLSESQYLEILKRFYGFYKSFEAALSDWAPHNEAAAFYIENRRKTHLLEVDLRAFGLSDREITLLPCLQRKDLGLTSDVSLWGAIYVIEGSTLGGQMITKKMSTKFPLIPSLRFFESYRELTIPRWKETLAQLGAITVSDAESVTQAAVQTFLTLRVWFSGPSICRPEAYCRASIIV